jgi:hypothetical protein
MFDFSFSVHYYVVILCGKKKFSSWSKHRVVSSCPTPCRENKLRPLCPSPEHITEPAPYAHYLLQERARCYTQVAAGNNSAAAVGASEHTLAVRML